MTMRLIGTFSRSGFSNHVGGAQSVTTQAKRAEEPQENWKVRTKSAHNETSDLRFRGEQEVWHCGGWNASVIQ